MLLVKSGFPQFQLTPKPCRQMQTNALECRQNADKFYLYYSLHGKGNDITETREWRDFTWRGSDCEELVEEVNHTAKFVTDLFSFVVVTRIFM